MILIFDGDIYCGSFSPWMTDTEMRANHYEVYFIGTIYNDKVTVFHWHTVQSLFFKDSE